MYPQPTRLFERLIGMRRTLTASATAVEQHTDDVFAPVDHDRVMERIGGGFETEVYCTEDRRYLVKLQSQRGSDLPTALQRARAMRAIAEQIVAALGPEHSVPSAYVLSRDTTGQVQVLVVQPFLHHAQPLARVDYAALSTDARHHLAVQLRDILHRARSLYGQTGWMPDLYGLYTGSSAERKRLAAPYLLLWHLWSFLVGRTLLKSVNLLLTAPPASRVVLVDYDRVPWSPWVRHVYFAVRWVLSWRDNAVLHWLERHSGNGSAADSAPELTLP